MADPMRRVRKVRKQTGQLRQVLCPWTSQPGGRGEEKVLMPPRHTRVRKMHEGRARESGLVGRVNSEKCTDSVKNL